MEQLAYAAGVIDSDGYISILTSHNAKHCLRVGVDSTSAILIDWLYKNFGGHIYSRRKSNRGSLNKKIIWTWCLNGKEAHDFLRQISSYLVIKKADAYLVMDAFPSKALVQAYEILRTRRSEVDAP